MCVCDHDNWCFQLSLLFSSKPAIWQRNGLSQTVLANNILGRYTVPTGAKLLVSGFYIHSLAMVPMELVEGSYRWEKVITKRDCPYVRSTDRIASPTTTTTTTTRCCCHGLAFYPFFHGCCLAKTRLVSRLSSEQR